jgi:hypothetical protein
MTGNGRRGMFKFFLTALQNLTRRQIIWRSPSWVRYFAVRQSRQNKG